MVGMPYYYEIGPMLEVLSDFLEDDARAIQALRHLRDPNVIATEFMGLDSTNLNAGPLDTFDKRVAALNRDWFGMTRDRSGKWIRQASSYGSPPYTTGRWVNWWGDAEGIARTTVARAIEVALGMAPDQPIVASAPPARHWPITFVWKCGQPWFEGWVTWRGHGADGNVFVVFSTPGNGDPIRPTPLAPPTRQSGDYGEHPVKTGASALTGVGDRGHWVVAQEHQYPLPNWQPSSSASTFGNVVLPIGFGPMVTVSDGPVVTVAPSEIDGGVKATGRPYQP
jgi:hypothetical protein